ncbi:hypothetical protein B4153_1063 [Bacillus cereus]|nr:hypothetical protein B4153_1063 [Bacillus cereus]KLA11256.1 hypothetical protein B4078_1021 [Bacillus cereus]
MLTFPLKETANIGSLFTFDAIFLRLYKRKKSVKQFEIV